jgi:hypothetical protein
MKPRLLLVALIALVCTAAAAMAASATGHSDDRHHRRSYEVWLIDQEDKFNASSGTLHSSTAVS